MELLLQTTKFLETLNEEPVSSCSSIEKQQSRIDFRDATLVQDEGIHTADGTSGLLKGMGRLPVSRLPNFLRVFLLAAMILAASAMLRWHKAMQVASCCHLLRINQNSRLLKAL